jgi:hypothetical protein
VPGSVDVPILVVGAGISGLSCARELAAGGRTSLVLDRARGVGGRCATRRVEGHPMDFGVCFLHGRDPGFLAALDQVPAAVLPGWPRQVLGTGSPCQPDAFSAGERRLAFAEGVTAFPKHLAQGLDVRLRTPVASLQPGSGHVDVRLEDGAAIRAGTVVVSVAAEEAGALLDTALPEPHLSAAIAILRLAWSEPCLALLALYPEGTPAPAWQIALPEESRVVQLASNESSKRKLPAAALVLQAHAAWSRKHAVDQAWPRLLLEEAGRLFGPWAAAPRLTSEHRWRYARSGMAAELAAPMLLHLKEGGRIGLCGDRFGRGGGIEGAWLSGRKLARRILAEMASEKEPG